MKSLYPKEPSTIYSNTTLSRKVCNLYMSINSVLHFNKIDISY